MLGILARIQCRIARPSRGRSQQAASGFIRDCEPGLAGGKGQTKKPPSGHSVFGTKDGRSTNVNPNPQSLETEQTTGYVVTTEAWDSFLPKTFAAIGMVLRAPTVSNVHPTLLRCPGLNLLAKIRPMPTPNTTRVIAIRAISGNVKFFSFIILGPLEIAIEGSDLLR